jgi:hypothetical protein
VDTHNGHRNRGEGRERNFKKYIILGHPTLHTSQFTDPEGMEGSGGPPAGPRKNPALLGFIKPGTLISLDLTANHSTITDRITQGGVKALYTASVYPEMSASYVYHKWRLGRLILLRTKWYLYSALVSLRSGYPVSTLNRSTLPSPDAGSCRIGRNCYSGRTRCASRSGRTLHSHRDVQIGACHREERCLPTGRTCSSCFVPPECACVNPPAKRESHPVVVPRRIFLKCNGLSTHFWIIVYPSYPAEQGTLRTRARPRFLEVCKNLGLDSCEQHEWSDHTLGDDSHSSIPKGPTCKPATSGKTAWPRVAYQSRLSVRPSRGRTPVPFDCRPRAG